MQSRPWLTSDLRQRRLFGLLRRSTQRRAQRRLVLLLCAAMLTVCALLLSGCTTPLPTTCKPMPPPSMPAASEPLPSESYSKQWQALVESLQQKLTGTPVTSK